MKKYPPGFVILFCLFLFIPILRAEDQPDPVVAFKSLEGITPADDTLTLKEEVQNLKKQLRTFQQYITQKDEKIVSLTKQLIDFTLALSEKEMLLSKKIEEFANLNQALSEAGARLELSQKIIQEKEEKLKLLEHSINIVSGEMVKTQEEKTAEVNQLNGFLNIYKAKLKETKDILNQRNEEFAVFQKEHKLRELTLQEKDKEIDTLKKIVDHLRLKQKDAALKQKFEDILAAEKRLSNLEQELSAKAKILEKARGDLIDLEASSQRLQEEFAKSMSAPELCREIFRLQSELAQIRGFLKRQANHFEVLLNEESLSLKVK